MAEVQGIPLPLESKFIPLVADPPRKSLFFRCLYGMGRCLTSWTTVRLAHFGVASATLGLLTYIGNEMTRSLNDASEILKDVTLIVPEIKRSLQILQNICDAPQYQPYCG